MLYADEVFVKDLLVVRPDIAEFLQGQMRALEFRRSECLKMKDALVESDTHATGGLPLSKFYSKTLDGGQRFTESESYLREGGSLDETSSWRGKQVIIPNYVQAVSN